MKTKKFRILSRGLVDVPVWSDRERDRNWAATVLANPDAPGGMNRKFWKSGRGEISRYVVPETLELYDVIEFAADRVTYGGTKYPNRVYCIVLELTDVLLTVTELDSAADAFLLASEMKTTWLADKKAAREAVTSHSTQATSVESDLQLFFELGSGMKVPLPVAPEGTKLAYLMTDGGQLPNGQKVVAGDRVEWVLKDGKVIFTINGVVLENESGTEINQ